MLTRTAQSPTQTRHVIPYHASRLDCWIVDRPGGQGLEFVELRVKTGSITTEMKAIVNIVVSLYFTLSLSLSSPMTVDSPERGTLRDWNWNGILSIPNLNHIPDCRTFAPRTSAPSIVETQYALIASLSVLCIL